MSDQNPNRMERDALVSEVDRLRALGDALADAAECAAVAGEPRDWRLLRGRLDAWRAAR